MQKHILRRALTLVLVSALVADAQTKKEGLKWGDRRTYSTLGPKRVAIPEKVMEAGLAIYTKEHMSTLFDMLPSPPSWKVWKLIGLEILKDNPYAVVPVQPADITRSKKDWFSMRVEAIPDSMKNENWAGHRRRLKGPQRMPTAKEVTWFVRVMWEVLGQLPFSDVYIRTSTPAGDRVHICLGQNELGVLRSVSCADDVTSVEVDGKKFPIGLAPVVEEN